MEPQAKLSASFRDPSGFLFRRAGVLYRQVNLKYKPDYDRLMQSGLYQKLVDAGLLIRHAERGPADMVLALALVHHLAISNNVPLDRLAETFAWLGRWLVIEFVPKEDSQVQRLLATREDIFDGYHLAGFEQAFSSTFELVEKMPLQGSQRTLYLMKAKN